MVSHAVSPNLLNAPFNKNRASLLSIANTTKELKIWVHYGGMLIGNLSTMHQGPGSTIGATLILVIVIFDLWCFWHIGPYLHFDYPMLTGGISITKEFPPTVKTIVSVTQPLFPGILVVFFLSVLYWDWILQPLTLFSHGVWCCNL
jgi:hypothetical protein